MAVSITDELSSMLKNSEFPLYERAVMFAAAAHSGMTRKGSRIPYLSHPVEAAAIVAEMTDDEELIAAAVLHDVVEDTPATSEEVEALADKLSNLRAIARDVDSVGDRIWERFHQNDKKMHGWLYRQTAEALRELASYPAWKEYDRLIKKVFEQE